jgi:hypothetical protein
MDSSPPRDGISMGALTLILCLALPVGLLSLFAPLTTGDAVNAADSILVARVAALQEARSEGLTVVRFEVERSVAGLETGAEFEVQLTGRPALEVSDDVLVMLSFDPPTLHAVLQLSKDPRTLEYLVLNPVTGLMAEGVSEQPNQPLSAVEDAIRRRRGLGARSPRSAAPAADDAEAGLVDRTSGTAAFGTSDDHGDDIASATPVHLDRPHPLTGMPTSITGLLTPGDVDFFSFGGALPALLHAETRLPAGSPAPGPDTFMGLFDAELGELLAFDDDSGDGSFSRLLVPLETYRTYAIAVEGAPDTDLDFSGDEGMQTGPYELLLELEQASYISNRRDFTVGVSVDGSFLEDLVGFKHTGEPDVLTQGVPADGWGLQYDVLQPTGLVSRFGGAGDFLMAPGFDAQVLPLSLQLGPFGSGAALNPNGKAVSRMLLPTAPGLGEGLELIHEYRVALNQSVVDGTVAFRLATTDLLLGVFYSRLLDVDLFGSGPDTFFWSLGAPGDVSVFPTELNSRLSIPNPPASAQGSVTGDRQVAMVIPAGTLAGGSPAAPLLVRYSMAFTLVSGFASEQEAVQAAQQNLLASDMQTWTIAVDVDPGTGLHTAFGTGLSEL